MELDMSLTTSMINTSYYEEALQELDLLMYTTKTQLIGVPEYGLDMETFLWELLPSMDTIKEHITTAIQKYTMFAQMFRTDISVTEAEGTERSIYIVKIDLYDDNNDNPSLVGSKTYIYK